ncbi:NUDIX hydrolase [Chondromyces apiculatus]|uniref:NUDIX hydrolase n=1 Tax=Chondromyces apiculatus TaxID=51 RepID=UPI001E3C5F2A|nr:NUDIX hydrolase [Chondromyces apiculatus]
MGAVVLDRSGPGAPRVVLVRRARPPLAGRWSLPGGSVEPGERLADAVVREVHEETGLAVQVGPLIEILEILEPPYHYVILDYVCEIVSGVLRADDDASEAVMVPLDALSAYDLTEDAERVIQGSPGLPVHPVRSTLPV